jgi:hypothetical protein
MVMAGDFTIAETGAPVSTLKDRLISANAYIGAEPIVRGLAEGARLVITGRAADPSLFVAPLAHSLGWPLDAWSGERQRRGGHCRHLQGAAALRDPRSLGVHHS